MSFHLGNAGRGGRNGKERQSEADPQYVPGSVMEGFAGTGLDQASQRSFPATSKQASAWMTAGVTNQ